MVHLVDSKKLEILMTAVDPLILRHLIKWRIYANSIWVR